MSDQEGQPSRAVQANRPASHLAESTRRSSQTVALTLEERILSGELAAGDRLPSERQLAVEFGASRPMVREALRSLIERGLIDVAVSSRWTWSIAAAGPQRASSPKRV